MSSRARRACLVVLALVGSGLTGCGSDATSRTGHTKKQVVPMPGMLLGAGFGFDPIAGDVLAFGGKATTVTGPETTTGPTAGTYSWSAELGWRQLHPAHRPSAREGALLAPFAGRLLLVDGAVRRHTQTACASPASSVSQGGQTEEQGCAVNISPIREETPADSWTWTGTDWVPQPQTGLPASGDSLVADPTTGGLLLAGNSAPGNVSGLAGARTGSWELNASHPTAWHYKTYTEAPGDTAAPDLVSGALLAYTGNAAFVAGPGVGAPNRGGTSTTFVFHGRWVPQTAVAEDAAGVLSTDPRTGRAVLVTALGHTFTWTGTTWARQQIPGPPPGSLPTLISDTADHLVLAVFTDPVRGDSTWTYNGHWDRDPRVTP